MYLGFLGIIPDGHPYAMVIAPYIGAVAILMVSRVPTYSGKSFGSRIPREMVLPIFGACALGVGLLWSYPYATMSAVVIIYLAIIPWSYRRFQHP